MRITIIFLTYMILSLNIMAGEILHGKIFMDKVSIQKLQEIKYIAKDKLKYIKNNSLQWGYEVFPESDIIIFWGDKNILMGLDVLNIAIFNEKVEIIDTVLFNKYGYIQNESFEKVKNAINYYRDIENYAVEISTQ